jgi:UDP-N-acetylmuramyl pentapeptide phosphotransferase/UDP-N-acetylglucosamine-1-phosphate transferase
VNAWFAALVALAVTAIVMPGLIVALRHKEVLDHPNERSSHQQVTVRGAGVAVAIGSIAGLVSWNPHQPGRWWLAAAAVGFGVVGFLDDVRSLSPKLRLGVQFAGSVAALALASLTHQIGGGWWLAVLGAFGVMAYVNAFNFMDGINGISGSQAAVAGVALALAGHRVHSDVAQLGGLVIAGAAVGFLPFNVPQARAFLGDVGSYFIGAWLALVAVVVFDRGAGFVAVAAIGSVYATDTAFTLVRRVVRGEDWWSPHRQHAYQRLTDTGLSHVAVASIVAVFTAGASTLGVLSVGQSASVSALLLAGAALVCALYLATPSLAQRIRQR